jgi:CUB domain
LPGCGGLLSGPSGNFSSNPGGSPYYRLNAQCTWYICVRDPGVVQLHFVQFQTEPNADFVTVYDGYGTSQPAIRR